MTIPMLQGPSDYIAPELGKIAGAVQQIVQPYKRIELALQGAIAENPELAQKLTDMEFMSPGSTAQLFGPNAGQYFAGARPSNEAIIEKTVTPFVEKALKSGDVASFIGTSRATGGKTTPGGVEEDLYKGRIAKATAEALEASPELLGAATIRKATGLPVGTYEEQRVKATTAATAAKIIATEKPDVMLTKLLKGVTGEEGGYTPGELNAIFSQPMSKALEFQLRAKISEEANKTREQIAKMKADATDEQRQDAVRRLLVYNALLESRTTGYSTPAAFLALNLGPDSPLVQEFGGVTQDQLIQAQLARDLTKRQLQEKGANPAFQTINSMMRTFLKAKANDAEPDELAGIVAGMNAVGNPHGYNALYDEKNGLRVMRPDGSIIDPASVVESVTPVQQVGPPTAPVTPPAPSGAGAAGPSRTRKSSVTVTAPASSFTPLSANAKKAYAPIQGARNTVSRRKLIDLLKKQAEISPDAKKAYDELVAAKLIQ